MEVNGAPIMLAIKIRLSRSKVMSPLLHGFVVFDTNVCANSDEFSASGVELELRYSNREYFDGALKVNSIEQQASKNRAL